MSYSEYIFPYQMEKFSGKILIKDTLKRKNIIKLEKIRTDDKYTYLYSMITTPGTHAQHDKKRPWPIEKHWFDYNL